MTEQPRLNIGPTPPAGYRLEEYERTTTDAAGRRRPILYYVAVQDHGTPATGLASIRAGRLNGLALSDRYYRDAPANTPPPADTAT